eukprot:COSAG01_NODE_32693_length_577_cov_0.918410_1_plen_77_part_00
MKAQLVEVDFVVTPHVIATQLAAVRPQSAGQAVRLPHHRWPIAIGQPVLRQCGQSISLTAKKYSREEDYYALKIHI